MKALSQAIASVFSAGALLGSMAAQAYTTTPIAELPLKASVLAKPNVIFGMDDSSSMDWELLLDTNQGVLWWNPTGQTPYQASGAPVFGVTSSDPWGYLFPNGVGTSTKFFTWNNYWGHAVPPTPQFAAMRSSRFNPLYYNPDVVYSPWPAAYHDGALKSYANATPTAAKSHPAVTGSATMDLTNTVALSTTQGFFFRGYAGVYIPAGAQRSSTGAAGSWTTIGVGGETLTGTRYVAMPYFPATYWKAETCTAQAITNINATCVLHADGVTTLKRYEIRAANYSSTAAYNAAMQNFANWWSYYRKRKLMLAGSMGTAMENLSGVRMGVVSFTLGQTEYNKASPAATTMYDADATAAASNRLRVAGFFYTNPGNGSTWTAETLKYIGDQYTSKNTATVQYACQRNNAFIVTDGFANANPVTPPAYTTRSDTNAAPYTPIQANMLADIATSYFSNNLRPDLATGKVPLGKQDVTNKDSNTNLHMNTYAITLGAKGTVWPGITNPFGATFSWPTVSTSGQQESIDDLWHATINGRGQMYLASSPEETALGIQAALNDILSQTGAQGGIAVSTVNLSRGDSRAYFGTYNPAGWAGDLTSNAIDPATGVVSTTPTWRAASLLAARDWNTRVIATKGGGFTAAQVGSTVNPGGVWGVTTEVMDYLRGDRSLEGDKFRIRSSLMGAVINSEPVTSREDNVVYVASGEGMLHAFDTLASGNPGKELWAFVPPALLVEIGETSARSYGFKTKLDGTPVIGKTSSGGKLLVSGMGASGNSYFALDVSSPRSMTESALASALKWEFPAADDSTNRPLVGQTLGRPVIVKVGSSDVVLVTSGFNSSDGKGRLWMLKASDGTVLKNWVLGDGSVDSGLAHVAAFSEADGSVRYAYGGDLQGNLWRFDLQSSSSSDIDPTLVAVLKSGSGVRQPVTTPPELLWHKNKRIIVVGTGRLLDAGDFGAASLASQSIYAIADGSALSNARDSLVAKTYTRGGNPELSTETVSWATQRGWYFDLPANEQINTRPSIAYGALAFVSNLNGGADCNARSWLYLVNVLDGGKLDGTAAVTNVISTTSNSSGVTALVTKGRKVVGTGQDADGKPWERDIISGQPINPAKNAWREIRR